MKFQVGSARYWKNDEQLKAYPCLKKYHVHKYNGTLHIKIHSLAQLIKLMKDLNHNLIIREIDNKPLLLIYDDGYID